MHIKIFYPSINDDDIGEQGLMKFLTRPGTEIIKYLVLPPDVVRDQTRIAVVYRPNNGESRNRDYIEDHGDVERALELASLVRYDKVHGGARKFQSLKNETQRRLFLLEFFNVTRSDFNAVSALLSTELYSLFFKDGLCTQ